MECSALPADLANVYISQAGFGSKKVDDQRHRSECRHKDQDVELELHRYKAMQQLREAFDSHVTKELGLKVAHQTFEKWLFCALHFSSMTNKTNEITRVPKKKTREARQASDTLQQQYVLAEPLIPRITSIGQAPKADAIVIDAVADAGGSGEGGIQLLKALYSSVVRNLADLAARSSVATGRISAARQRVLVISKLDSVTIVCKSSQTVRSSQPKHATAQSRRQSSSSRGCAGPAVKAGNDAVLMRLALTVPHFRKLRVLFDRACGQGTTLKPPAGANRRSDAHDDAIAFRRALFCLLARYRSLSGDYSQGAGFQAAVPPACLQVMQSLWGVDCECFASPLNCFFPKFCSLFPDTDCAFGSLGSFFDLQPRRYANTRWW